MKKITIVCFLIWVLLGVFMYTQTEAKEEVLDECEFLSDVWIIACIDSETGELYPMLPPASEMDNHIKWVSAGDRTKWQYNEATIEYVSCKRIKDSRIMCINTETTEIWYPEDKVRII